MRLLKLTILFSMLFCLCAEGQNLDTTHAFVFPADSKVMLIKVAPGAKRFAPSSNEVRIADSLLLKYLGNSNELKAIGDTFHSYFRQYVGVEKPGLKGIYINAFCRKPDYFTEDTVYPKGGGICYFRTLINISSLKVEDFSYNAPK
jgi:hypothetical protein